MTRQSWFLLTAVLTILGAGATVLAHLKNHQHLGKPGVKVVAQEVLDPEGKVVGTNAVFLPEQVLNFASTPQPIARLVLDWLPKDTVYGQRLYRAPDGFEMLMNVVLMGADRTSIHKPQYCLTGAGWRIDQSELTFLPLGEPHDYDLPVMKLTATHSGTASDGSLAVERGIYVYWFVADNELTAEHGQRMWWMVRDMIRTGLLQRWAYVACFAVCAPGQEEKTYGRMKELIAAAVPRFQLTAGALPASKRQP